MTAATRSQGDGLFNAAIGALEVASTNICDPLDCYRPPDTEELRLPSDDGQPGWLIWRASRAANRSEHDGHR